MGNVLNLGNVRAILQSSDSLCVQKLFLSSQNNLAGPANSAGASAIACSISSCNAASFRNEFERQSDRQAYENRLNSIRQSVNSSVLKLSGDPAAGSALYKAAGKFLSSFQNTSRSTSVKIKNSKNVTADSENHNLSDRCDRLSPVSGSTDSTDCEENTDPYRTEQELNEILMYSKLSGYNPEFENDTSLDDTPIFFSSEYSRCVSSSMAKLVDNMVDTLLSYQSTPLNQALCMIKAVSEIMKAVNNSSDTALVPDLNSSAVSAAQYNPKAHMLPLYILGCSLIDYIRRYNCKEFNYRKERQKAEEKIAHNEKEHKKRMAQFAAEFQFGYS